MRHLASVCSGSLAGKERRACNAANRADLTACACVGKFGRCDDEDFDRCDDGNAVISVSSDLALSAAAILDACRLL
jgi:hypothetical protein